MKLNQSKFAQLIGKSGQYVALLVEQGLPAQRRGRRGSEVIIDGPRAIAWLLERERQKVRAELAPEAPTTEAETRRLRAAQADLVELEAAERRGELAPVEDMQVAANETMVIVRTTMEAIASRCAAELAGMTQAGLIRHYLLGEIRQGLSAAAHRVEEWAASVAKVR